MPSNKGIPHKRAFERPVKHIDPEFFELPEPETWVLDRIEKHLAKSGRPLLLHRFLKLPDFDGIRIELIETALNILSARHRIERIDKGRTVFWVHPKAKNKIPVYGE